MSAAVRTARRALSELAFLSWVAAAGGAAHWGYANVIRSFDEPAGVQLVLAASLVVASLVARVVPERWRWLTLGGAAYVAGLSSTFLASRYPIEVPPEMDAMGGIFPMSFTLMGGIFPMSFTLVAEWVRVRWTGKTCEPRWRLAAAGLGSAVIGLGPWSQDGIPIAFYFPWTGTFEWPDPLDAAWSAILIAFGLALSATSMSSERRTIEHAPSLSDWSGDVRAEGLLWTGSARIWRLVMTLPPLMLTPLMLTPLVGGYPTFLPLAVGSYPTFSPWSLATVWLSVGVYLATRRWGRALAFAFLCGVAPSLVYLFLVVLVDCVHSFDAGGAPSSAIYAALSVGSLLLGVVDVVATGLCVLLIDVGDRAQSALAGRELVMVGLGAVLGLFWTPMFVFAVLGAAILVIRLRALSRASRGLIPSVSVRRAMTLDADVLPLFPLLRLGRVVEVQLASNPYRSMPIPVLRVP